MTQKYNVLNSAASYVRRITYSQSFQIQNPTSTGMPARKTRFFSKSLLIYGSVAVTILRHIHYINQFCNFRDFDSLLTG
jgi:hypothetical protein